MYRVREVQVESFLQLGVGQKILANVVNCLATAIVFAYGWRFFNICIYTLPWWENETIIIVNMHYIYIIINVNTQYSPYK